MWRDGYLLVLSPTFDVEYASYLGGSANDEACGLVVGAQGNAIIVGNATSEDFPVKNPLQPSCPSDTSLKLCWYDGFACKLSPSAGLIYSTYITSLNQPDDRTFIGEQDRAQDRDEKIPLIRYNTASLASD